MTERITSSTRLLVLLGDPVAHSLSPVIQNAAFRQANVDGVYVAIRSGEEDLQGLMLALARAGGGGNITLPHKERAAAVVSMRSEAVRRTGACNTFWGESGKLYGDNTDVEGFRRALTYFLGRSVQGHRVLMLGAGGAARGALVALLDEGVRDVVMLNRSTERARAVARRIGGHKVRVAPTVDDVSGDSFDLVINATRLGLEDDDPLPIELSRLDGVGAVLDLVYRAGSTAFVQAAREFGVRATDGGEMLVQQGAVAFERWWGVDAPVDAMRRALDEVRVG